MDSTIGVTVKSRNLIAASISQMPDLSQQLASIVEKTSGQDLSKDRRPFSRIDLNPL